MQIICDLVGANFRPPESREAVKNLSIGDILPLERDPSNPYDTFAIKVISPEGDHLGFIPKTHNFELASAMDADPDADWQAEVVGFNSTLKPTLSIAFA